MRCDFQRAVVRVMVAFVLIVSLPGCGLFGKVFKSGKEKPPTSEAGEKEVPEQAPVRLVGEVASVHAAEGFVLIRRYAQANFGVGQLISGLSAEGTSSSLQLTGEKMGRFYAADIQEGTPKAGDLVIARRLPEESLAPSTPVPETSKPSENAPWMKNLPIP